MKSLTTLTTLIETRRLRGTRPVTRKVNNCIHRFISYTSQVTEITGVLEAGQSEGEGGTRGMVDAVIRRYACERNVPA
jgi:hypothetical protein